MNEFAPPPLFDVWKKKLSRGKKTFLPRFSEMYETFARIGFGVPIWKENFSDLGKKLFRFGKLLFSVLEKKNFIDFGKKNLFQLDWDGLVGPPPHSPPCTPGPSRDPPDRTHLRTLPPSHTTPLHEKTEPLGNKPQNTRGHHALPHHARPPHTTQQHERKTPQKQPITQQHNAPPHSTPHPTAHHSTPHHTTAHHRQPHHTTVQHTTAHHTLKATRRHPTLDTHRTTHSTQALLAA